jgi:hypothetical protein
MVGKLEGIAEVSIETTQSWSFAIDGQLSDKLSDTSAWSAMAATSAVTPNAYRVVFM